MRYQLVLQWPASSITDYDAMIAIEDALIENLSREHEVDGHDFGSGEVNVFILTDDAERVFEETRSILGGGSSWDDVRVAYRDITASDFTILWPEGLKDFRVM